MNSLSTTNRNLPAKPSLFAALAVRWVFKLCSGIECGALNVTLPGGEQRSFRGTLPGPEADCRIRHWRAIRRIVMRGDLGFAEAFMDGDWCSTDVTALLDLALANKQSLEARVKGAAMMRIIDRIRHLLRPNTRRGSRRNIQEHYDLGNAFYGQWLDPTMTYSSALYESPNDPLEAAQVRKYERIASVLNPRPGMHILEIGCGWGGFATYLARTYGCHVSGITLSQEQHDFAQARIAREGLAEQVDIRIQDYRDVRGKYDGIASIEMFEAVGETNWPQFFRIVADRLAPNAHAAMQVITIDESRYEDYRQGADFIQRYVFPGGMLPSPTVFRQYAELAGLKLHDAFFFGQSYAQTIAEWQTRFTESWPEIEKVGFDERFRRLWEYYLAYCRAGFQGGSIDVGQFVLGRA